MFLEPLPPRFIITPIVGRVQAELAETQRREPLADLEKRARDARPMRDFERAVAGSFGLIAEIKRTSPSMGAMRNADVADTAAAYEQSPAVRAISVLTNRADFGMSIGELAAVGALTAKPLLRKDFIFDPYQVWQARAHGADAILLMANILTPAGLHELSALAHSLGLAVLFELHTADEIAKLPPNPRLCGINSRVFKSNDSTARYLGSKMLRLLGFKKDLSIKHDQFAIASQLPAGALKIAESGVDPAMVPRLCDELGFHCMLVGTSLLMAADGVRAELTRFEQQLAQVRPRPPLADVRSAV
jgi:indole-3-glycerol phosphate synthase